MHWRSQLDLGTRRGRFLLILGFWTVQGLLWVVQQHVAHRLDGRQVPLVQVITLQMATAWAWAAATPIVLQLGRRFRFEGGRWARSLAVHLLASLAIVLAINVVFVSLWAAIGKMEGSTPLVYRLLRMYIGLLDFNVLIYWVILGLQLAADHLRRHRQRELQASQLETQLARARLDALEMQLHPHFLFNALHTVAALVRTGQNPRAIRVVAQLGDLLRSALDRSGAPEVPLKEELAFLDRYLAIEQVRFGDRLQVRMDIDPEALDARVPWLILQPLVENAIRHGLGPRAEAGSLTIRARRRDGRVELLVADDGQGLPPGFDLEQGCGVGLPITRQRLEHMYGQAQSFAVRAAPGGGTEVALSLPFTRAAAEWQG